MIRRFAAASAALLLAALAVSSCSTWDSEGDASASPSSSAPRGAQFPRTVKYGDTKVTIPERPARIATISHEAAEVIAELGGANTLVAVPKSSTNPVMTHHQKDMEKVKTTLPAQAEITSKAILATRPDLVIMPTSRGTEDKACAGVKAAGVPVVTIPNTWADVDELHSNVTLLGKLTGREAQATAWTKKYATLLWHDFPPGDHPRILVLANEAGKPSVVAGKAFPLTVIRAAGGTDAGKDLGMTHSGPITAEQVVATKPDGILLVDRNGSGEKMFQSLLINDAVARLHAPVLTVQAKSVQALGLQHVSEGRDKILEWIRTLR